MLHLYAISPRSDDLVLDMPGVDSSRPDVYSVPSAGLSAIVSASPSVDYRSLRRDELVPYLVKHQQVIERLIQLCPLLPVKFGTVLPSEAHVTGLLAQGAGLFRNALQAFSGLVQMELVVLWKLQEVMQEIAGEKSIVEMKAKALAPDGEPTVADRIAIGRKVQEILEDRRVALQEHLIASVRHTVRDIAVNPIMDGSMVANLALLVDKSSCEMLEQQLDDFDKEFEGRLHVRYVGPLPPYSFATVELLSPSFEGIEKARRSLDVPETVTLDTIKDAYHRLAGRVHPDHNPDDPDADARMAELAQSYSLLASYAQSRLGDQENAEQSPCHFDRDAVDNTLMVMIRRQGGIPDADRELAAA